MGSTVVREREYEQAKQYMVDHPLLSLDEAGRNLGRSGSTMSRIIRSKDYEQFVESGKRHWPQDVPATTESAPATAPMAPDIAAILSEASARRAAALNDIQSSLIVVRWLLRQQMLALRELVALWKGERADAVSAEGEGERGA